MKSKVLFSVLFCLLLTACKQPFVTIPDLFENKLSDSRFNGNFTYADFWTDSDGIEENNEYTSFRFDGSTKVFFYNKFIRYSRIGGWSYSGNYPGDSYAWYLEFEVQNGKYRTRLWDNSYDTWKNWQSYSFSDNGATLTLNNFLNVEGYNLTLSKSSGSKALTRSNSDAISGNQNTARALEKLTQNKKTILNSGRKE